MKYYDCNVVISVPDDVPEPDVRDLMNEAVSRGVGMLPADMPVTPLGQVRLLPLKDPKASVLGASSPQKSPKKPGSKVGRVPEPPLRSSKSKKK